MLLKYWVELLPLMKKNVINAKNVKAFALLEPYKLTNFKYFKSQK